MGSEVLRTCSRWTLQNDEVFYKADKRCYSPGHAMTKAAGREYIRVVEVPGRSSPHCLPRLPGGESHDISHPFHVHRAERREAELNVHIRASGSERGPDGKALRSIANTFIKASLISRESLVALLASTLQRCTRNLP